LNEYVENKQKSTSIIDEKEKPATNTNSKQNSIINVAIIGNESIFYTSPLLLIFEIFSENVRNCLVDSGASSNVVSYYICRKLNAKLSEYSTHNLSRQIIN